MQRVATFAKEVRMYAPRRKATRTQLKTVFRRGRKAWGPNPAHAGFIVCIFCTHREKPAFLANDVSLEFSAWFSDNLRYWCSVYPSGNNWKARTNLF